MEISTAELPKNGKSHPTQLSSNATLFWRVFVPVFGTVFFTGLMLAFWLVNEDDVYIGAMPALASRLLMTAVWLGWLVLVRRTVWKLKRLDADDAHLFVTNYWTTVRYLWQDVERMEEKRHFFGRRVVHLWLRGAGRFGQKISFLPGTAFHAWVEEHGKGPLMSVN